MPPPGHSAGAMAVAPWGASIFNPNNVDLSINNVDLSTLLSKY
jgi:hypothetical protein